MDHRHLGTDVDKHTDTDEADTTNKGTICGPFFFISGDNCAFE